MGTRKKMKAFCISRRLGDTIIGVVIANSREKAFQKVAKHFGGLEVVELEQEKSHFVQVLRGKYEGNYVVEEVGLLIK